MCLQNPLIQSVLVLPVVILWQVRLSIRRKLTLAGLFGLTIFIVLCSILRLVIVLKTVVGTYMDNTWLFLWNKIELDTGKYAHTHIHSQADNLIAIVVACLGSFRILYTSRRDRKIQVSPIQESPQPVQFNTMASRTWSPWFNAKL